MDQHYINMKRSLEFVEKMYEEYLAGASQVELSKKYCSDVYYQFKTKGFKTRTTSESVILRRTGRMKLNYSFESISNEYEAYIVGFFMADGWVGRNQLGFRLKKSDVEIVERIKNYFHSNIKLQSEPGSNSFVVSSRTACLNAVKLGILSNKTKERIQIPDMDKSLVRHFIRGYFDGDGTIFICNSRGSQYLKGNICSPRIEILEEIQKVLIENGIFCTINKENRKGKKMACPNINGFCVGKMDMYRLFFRKKHSIKRLFNYFYDNSTIFLQRKFNVFNDNKHLLKYEKIKYDNAEVSY